MNANVPLRVLIIDDDPSLRSTIALMLRRIGAFEVKDASDGTGALLLIGSFKPDIVLCDVGMEPMSGLDFVKRLRALADLSRASTPVIMVTGHSEEHAVLEAAKLRINGYLVKPVSTKLLAGRIDAIAQQTRG
jgi:two-component system chemotaxis response regulator CheY